MIRILQSLLALICLLILVLLATRAESAQWQEPDAGYQNEGPQTPETAPRSRPVHHRCLVPASQPGTHMQGQPFAYGYFGAHARPVAAFQRSYDADWFQWTVIRAD